jgi:glucose-6-phosphate isomerase
MEIENRSVNDLKKILYDDDWGKTASDFTVYRVRRGIKYKDGLRYDETVLSPRPLGKEFPKTKGHEHPRECVELIFVIRGQALFLLQKDEGKIVKDVYFIEAKKGQAIISPSGFSHITINPTDKELKIGTWVQDVCPSSYETIKTLKGAGYYYTLSGWQKNKNYSRVPKLKEKKPLQAIPRNLDFLAGGCCCQN